MPEGQVLEFTNVTKHFNELTAVSDFSARVEPGAVTAFLGPNGAGKTTTLRILLGQVRPTSGTATIGGTAYAELRQPLRVIGSVLEETAYRTRRTAHRQLTIAAKANGIPVTRVDEVLALVGLDAEADSRIGGFSLGMRQRLSVAHALLGDPGALVLDEPANGLDPEGIRWMRLLMRRLADEGRTVLVSSHVLSEVEQVADNVLVLSKGRLVLDSGIEKLADPKSGAVVVDAADRAALTAALSAAGFDIEVLRSGLTVRGGDAGTVGAIAAEAGIALSTLVQRGPTLEDVFMELTRGGKLSGRAGITAAAPVESDPETGAAADEPSLAADAAGETVEAAGAAGEPVEDSDSGETTAEPESGDETELDVDTAADDAAEDTADDAAEMSDHTDPQASDDRPAEQSAEQSTEQSADRSFDDILFGSGAPSDGSGDAADSGEVAGDAASDGDHAGVEFFSEADETDAAPGDASDAGASDAEASEADAGSDDDPRSAAVSSMLAAAARAYYDDEPRDYPQADTPSDDGAHWSVASTGVIDTVPGAAATEPVEQTDEHHEGGDEHHQGDDEHHQDGEHQQGEGEHHQGDGEHHNDGEHHHHG
ncbi:ATP-binding cassette domain-containing protein [Microbacterium sp. 179-I 3D2 NHS]|uniref:ATP-binding cassette domain-containing protein n=1 Tax=Microbacterium sp. 179-I 3D2 NHS TaxID=3235178 RepID=UPI00399F4C90